MPSYVITCRKCGELPERQENIETARHVAYGHNATQSGRGNYGHVCTVGCTCPTCGKWFAGAGGLRLHEQRHQK